MTDPRKPAARILSTPLVTALLLAGSTDYGMVLPIKAHRTICHRCRGTGMVGNGDTCPRCQGEGKR